MRAAVRDGTDASGRIIGSVGFYAIGIVLFHRSPQGIVLEGCDPALRIVLVVGLGTHWISDPAEPSGVVIAVE